MPFASEVFNSTDNNLYLCINFFSCLRVNINLGLFPAGQDNISTVPYNLHIKGLFLYCEQPCGVENRQVLLNGFVGVIGCCIFRTCCSMVLHGVGPQHRLQPGVQVNFGIES